MNDLPKTIVIRHRKENLKKCTLTGLEKRDDFHFLTYPLKELPAFEGYILLTLDAPVLTKCARGLIILDGTWRYATIMERTIAFGGKIIRRSLPRSLQTAYPRQQDDQRGLASIEAIVAAYTIMGRNTEGLLDNYYWKKAFLEKNPKDLIQSRL